MRVPLRWLEEFVDINIAPEKLGEMLDLSGTKVEGVERPGKGVKGVVVAEVANIEEHPDADNLILVDVKVSDSDVYRVVCGARNFAAGDRVPYARVGAVLPGPEGEDLQITERKIRGQASQGMLCSGRELGVSKDHSGILVLSPDAPLNEDVGSVLGLDTVVFEFEITSNRPDCMSVIGIAREVAVLLRTELKVSEIHVGDAEASPVKVRIDDPSGCPRYVARYIEGVRVAPSPAWMAARLVASGVRPISNIVDITNYVMLEYGQPLHAFDAALIHDETIVVRRAKRGEKMTTLDGVDRALHPDDLMITDPKKTLAIAGVMGGGESEVSDATTNVILESAHFEADAIAFTARRHQLRTEASARFERGADPEIVPIAAARAAQLMAELADGTLSGETDEYPAPPEKRTIELRVERTGEVLGAGLPGDVQAGFLTGLGFGITERDGVLVADVPTFRPDVRREEDLIEEVGRIAGFERLPASLPPGRTGGLTREQRFERRLREMLTSLGVAESWNSSLLRTGELDDLLLPQDHPARDLVGLSNPMSDEEPALRTSLLPGLLRSVARNHAQHAGSIALFELARTYEPSDSDLPTQPLLLGAAFAGERKPQGWNAPSEPWDFFAAKGVLDAVLDSTGIPAPVYEPVSGPPFHPTRGAALLYGGERVGGIGQLHPEVCERFDVPDGTVCFELGVAALLAQLPEREQIADLERFPSVYMDIAVVVGEEVPAAAVTSLIRETGTPELVDVRLFDLYGGEQVAAGKKSLAYALQLRVPDRTLTDEEAAAVRDRIVAALKDPFDATLRA